MTGGHVALGTVASSGVRVHLMGERFAGGVRLLLPQSLLGARLDGLVVGAVRTQPPLSMDPIINVLLRSKRLPAPGEGPGEPVVVDVLWFEAGATVTARGPFGLGFRFVQRQMPTGSRAALFEVRSGEATVLGHGVGVRAEDLEAVTAARHAEDGLFAVVFDGSSKPVVEDAVDFVRRHMTEWAPPEVLP